MSALLEMRGVSAGYGEVGVLRDVSVRFAEGRITAIVGSNGAGKTTTMRTLAGLITPLMGQVLFHGDDVSQLPAHVHVARGLALVPEGRLIFPDLTVAETLRIGAYTKRARLGWRIRVDRMYEFFPRLGERCASLAGSLSGGEQQMLAIARGLMSQPRILLLDEPSLGLAPAMADEMFVALGRIRSTGVSIGIVEQNVYSAMSICDYAYVMEDGAIVNEGEGAVLMQDDTVRSSYLGM